MYVCGWVGVWVCISECEAWKHFPFANYFCGNGCWPAGTLCLSGPWLVTHRTAGNPGKCLLFYITKQQWRAKNSCRYFISVIYMSQRAQAHEEAVLIGGVMMHNLIRLRSRSKLPSRLEQLYLYRFLHVEQLREIMLCLDYSRLHNIVLLMAIITSSAWPTQHVMCKKNNMTHPSNVNARISLAMGVILVLLMYILLIANKSHKRPNPTWNWSYLIIKSDSCYSSVPWSFTVVQKWQKHKWVTLLHWLICPPIMINIHIYS